MGVAASQGLACNDRPINSQDQANALVSGTITAVGPSKCFPVWGPFNVAVYGVLTDALTVTANSLTASVNSGTDCHTGDSISSTLVPKGTTAGAVSSTTVTLKPPTQSWMCMLPSVAAEIRFPGNQLPVGMTIAALVGATINDPNGFFGTGVTVAAVAPDGVSLRTSAPPGSVPANANPIPLEFALGASSITASGTDALATFTGGTTPVGDTTTSFQIERSFDGGGLFIPCNVGSSGTVANYTSLVGPLQLSFGDPEAGMLYRINTTVFAARANVVVNYRFSTTGQAGKSLQVPALS